MLGRYRLHGYEADQKILLGIQSFPHPNYTRPAHSNDLMLIKLNRKVLDTKGIKPINITTQAPITGAQCLVSGWGTTSSPHVHYPQVLQCLDIMILSQEVCQKAYPGEINSSMFCAGDEDGKDSCQGDSGGPVVCNGMLQGLVSWGDVPCGKPHRPGVYTNLYPFNKWIKDTIKNNTEPKPEPPAPDCSRPQISHVCVYVCDFGITASAVWFLRASSQDSGKGLGGEECAPHSQPWQVALFEGNRFNCGASLISSKWLLTAAHCITGSAAFRTSRFLRWPETLREKCESGLSRTPGVLKEKWESLAPKQARPGDQCTAPNWSPDLSGSNMRVRLGEHNLRVWEGVEQLRGVAYAFPHPRYKNRGHHDDIMLLRLTRPASLSDSVRPVALPTRCPRHGEQCVVSGWGLVTESKAGPQRDMRDRAAVPTVKLPDTLHCANISIISAASCDKDYRGQVTDTMVCAGVAGGGTDSCEGDSGGPLICGGMLQGIVSWGDVPCDTTAKPGVYTKVCKYLGWIRDVMKKY
ncbi:uncharacterized protein LOC110220046 [Phascolarctos cinereus]